MSDNNILSKYLVKYRKEHHLSQQSLADILGVSQSYYGSIERGKKQPGRELLLVISNKLNISLDSLLLNHSDYASKQLANEYVERLQALPRKERETVYNVMDILIASFNNETEKI